MALAGVKASDNPAVAVDDLGGTIGGAQAVRLLIGTLGNQAVNPGDATTGLWVNVRSFQGPLAVDAAITTEQPNLMGGRAFDLAPTKVSAEGDAQMLWLGTDGAVNTYNRVDGALVEAITNQPNAGANYVAGDIVGNVLQFNGAALASGRGLTINSVQCEDSTGTNAADINLALFCASPAGLPADNALFSGLTHANRIAAKPIAVVQFPAGNFVNGWCEGTVNGGPFAKNAYPTGTTVFGVAYIGTTLGGKATAANGSFWFGMDVTYN